MTKKLFIIIAALSLYSCNREDIDDSIKINEEPLNGQVTKIDNEVLQIKTKAVDTLTIGSNSFVLSTYLNRDFMPFCSPNGKRMISINWLISTDSVKIPVNIKMIKQYVIHGDSIWISNYLGGEQSSWPEYYKMRGASFNGPKWGPNIYVEVISHIHDFNTNQDYFIKHKDAYIRKSV